MNSTATPAPVKSGKPRTVKPAHGSCSLTLRINGTSYRVRPVACDPGSGARKCYQLTRADGTAYHVSQHDGWRECTCPDFIFNRDGLTYGPCKHLAALKVLNLID